MNRYQKPEVFERLAMDYVAGTMHGRARKRFEHLMKQHPFLEAVVEEKSMKFAQLIELLPEEKPAPSVWESINSELNQAELQPLLSKVDKPAPWWSWLFQKGFATAAVLLIITSVVVLKPGGSPSIPSAYAATLVSESQEPMVEVVAQKSDMKMMVKLMEPVEVPKGMEMHFWCIAKDKNEPLINMGTLHAKGMTEVELELRSWQGIVDASMFAISIEPEGSRNASPTGNVLFTGKLKALTGKT